MSNSLLRIVQFGGQILHNGSTHFATSYVDNSGKAKLDLIDLPNGAIFDPHGSNDAPVVPQPFQSSHVIVMSTPAAAGAELEAIKALVGTRDNIAAGSFDDTPGTGCLARLEKVIAKQRLHSPSNVLRFTLHFVPLENWS